MPVRGKARHWEPSAAMRRMRASAAQAFRVDLVELLGRGRTREVMRARLAAYWLLSTGFDLTREQLGMAMGGRDHSTVIHGVGRAEALRARDAAFRAVTDRLLEGKPPPPMPVDPAVVERLEIEAAQRREEAIRASAQACIPGDTYWGEDPDDPEPATAMRDEVTGETHFGGIAVGSLRLLAAIRRAHPERFGQRKAA